jgi:hypothetical protein
LGESRATEHGVEVTSTAFPTDGPKILLTDICEKSRRTSLMPIDRTLMPRLNVTRDYDYAIRVTGIIFTRFHSGARALTKLNAPFGTINPYRSSVGPDITISALRSHRFIFTPQFLIFLGFYVPDTTIIIMTLDIIITISRVPSFADLDLLCENSWFPLNITRIKLTPYM